MGIIPGVLEMISSLKLLTIDGIIVTEHDIRDDLPSNTKALEVVKSARYGDTQLTFYKIKA